MADTLEILIEGNPHGFIDSLKAASNQMVRTVSEMKSAGKALDLGKMISPTGIATGTLITFFAILMHDMFEMGTLMSALVAKTGQFGKGAGSLDTLGGAADQAGTSINNAADAQAALTHQLGNATLAQQVLGIAMKLARSEGADFGDTAVDLARMMQAYNITTVEGAQVLADHLIKAWAESKVSVSDLTGVLGDNITSFARAGVPIASLAGTLDVFRSKGMSASEIGGAFGDMANAIVEKAPLVQKQYDAIGMSVANMRKIADTDFASFVTMFESKAPTLSYLGLQASDAWFKYGNTIKTLGPEISAHIDRITKSTIDLNAANAEVVSKDPTTPWVRLQNSLKELSTALSGIIGLVNIFVVGLTTIIQLISGIISAVGKVAGLIAPGFQTLDIESGLEKLLSNTLYRSPATDATISDGRKTTNNMTSSWSRTFNINIGAGATPAQSLEGGRQLLTGMNLGSYDMSVNP